MTHKILLLAGDGIGPEIVGAATAVLQALSARFGFKAELEPALMGGAGIDATGNPLPDDTLRLARESTAILLGAVAKAGRAVTEAHEALRAFAVAGTPKNVNIVVRAMSITPSPPGVSGIAAVAAIPLTS